MTATAPTLSRYRLVAERRGAVARNSSNGGLKRDADRYARLTEMPPGFVPYIASYGEVAARATALNETQLRSGFLDYLYSPDPVEAKAPEQDGGLRS